MSDYKHEMSFDERCRQPLDAALRIQRRFYHQTPDPEAVARFKEWCQKFKKKQLDKQKIDDILPMLKEDR